MSPIEKCEKCQTDNQEDLVQFFSQATFFHRYVSHYGYVLKL